MNKKTILKITIIVITTLGMFLLITRNYHVTKEYQFALSLIFSSVLAVFLNIVATAVYDRFYKNKLSSSHEQKYTQQLFVKYLQQRFALSHERKSEMLALRLKYEPLLKIRRKKHINEMQTIFQQQTSAGTSIFQQPAWHTLSTTHSVKTYRLVMGFKNNGCAYWRNNDAMLGCFHCSYGSSAILPAIHEFSTDDLLNQFSKVKQWAAKNKYDYDVIEFLNDGSFLNFPEEFPNDFPELLFAELKRLTYVKRILVETRPEYVTEEKIALLVNSLDSQQQLEIGIGLETTNDFIRNNCINKGYGLREFEKAVKIISDFRDRCSIVVYIIIKPAFLSEREAIEDSIETIKYLSVISKEYSISMIPKIEPAVIAKGTMLDILHFEISKDSKERYEPLSYWSIVEIIARTYLLILHENIRVGAREDMDIIERVPAIYTASETFNQYDFWIYDSVQRFNTDHDIVKLMSDVKLVIEEDKDSSFPKWAKNVVDGSSAIDICINKLSRKINKYRSKAKQINRELFLKDVYKILDAVEIDITSHDFARKLRNGNEDAFKDDIERFIRSKFSNLHGNYEVIVNAHYFEKNICKMLRIYFQLYNLDSKCAHDIWVGIPTDTGIRMNA